MASVTVFRGEYDVASRTQLRKQLERMAFDAGVILDFSAVTFIDSTCVTELLRLQELRDANELDPLTIVVKSKGAIHRLFEVLDLLDRFRVVETLDDAVAKNGETVRVRYAVI
jgi:anti-anti-sigma factor